MTLEEMKKSFLDRVGNIEEYEKYQSNELADLYLENKHNLNGEKYYSVLVLRYWTIIPRLISSVSNYYNLNYEDCYEWYIEGMNLALKYQAWKIPTSTLYKDEKGFEKALNVCVSTARLNKLRALYTSSQRANAFNFSLEELKDNINYEPASNDHLPFLVGDIIYNYLENYDYLSAIIIDKICYSNAYIINYRRNCVFSIRKLRQELENIDEKYFQYFQKKYAGSSIEALREVGNQLNSLTIPQIARKLKWKLGRIKENLTSLGLSPSKNV